MLWSHVAVRPWGLILDFHIWAVTSWSPWEFLGSLWGMAKNYPKDIGIISYANIRSPSSTNQDFPTSCQPDPRWTAPSLLARMRRGRPTICCGAQTPVQLWSTAWKFSSGENSNSLAVRFSTCRIIPFSLVSKSPIPGVVGPPSKWPKMAYKSGY